MPGARKVGPGPLERIDQFIQEQKTRREAFWSKRAADKLPGSLAVKALSSQAPGSLQALAKGNNEAQTKNWNPANCIEHEVYAMKAIQARTDAIQRLRQCCDKVDEHVAARGGFVCNSNPILKMFFRLVGNVRVKTIDAVECVSSWERNVGRGRAFVYNGAPFLPALGEELRCLDGFDFVRLRIRQTSCADDPFLCDLTPLGVPIEPTSAFELRQGGRINQAALRLRMAMRTVEPRLPAVRHRSMTPPEPQSRLMHISPSGREKHGRNVAPSRIPGRSKHTASSVHTSLAQHGDLGPTARTQADAALDPSCSRLPRAPGRKSAGNRGIRLKSAPSQLSVEASTAALEHAPVTKTQRSGHTAAEQCHASPRESRQDSHGAAGSGSAGGTAREADMGGTPAPACGGEGDDHQRGSVLEHQQSSDEGTAALEGSRAAAGPDQSSCLDLVLPLPPPGVAHADASAASPLTPPMQSNVMERVSLCMHLQPCVHVVLSFPEGPTGGRPAPAGSSGAPPGADNAATAALDSLTEERGGVSLSGTFGAAGRRANGRVGVRLAVDQHVAVEMKVAPIVAVGLRVAPVDANRDAATPPTEHVWQDYIRLELQIVSQTDAMSQLAEADGEPSVLSTSSAAHNVHQSGHTAWDHDGSGGALPHACSLDAAVHEVVEELLEFVVACEAAPEDTDAAARARSLDAAVDSVLEELLESAAAGGGEADAVGSVPGACSIDAAVDAIVEEVLQAVAADLCPSAGGPMAEAALSADVNALEHQKAAPRAMQGRQEPRVAAVQGAQRGRMNAVGGGRVQVRLVAERRLVERGGGAAVLRGVGALEDRHGRGSALGQVQREAAGGVGCAPAKMPAQHWQHGAHVYTEARRDRDVVGEVSAEVGTAAEKRVGSSEGHDPCEWASSGLPGSEDREQSGLPPVVDVGDVEAGLVGPRVSVTSVVVDDVVQELLDGAIGAVPGVVELM
eukprot:jgi/Ulvmu1/9693/UM055_0031.1